MEYLQALDDSKEKTAVIPAEAPEIDIDQLAGAVRGSATIIDVREPGEYVAGHIPGAVLIPIGQLPGRTAELARQAPVYLVGASANRSAAMTDFPRGAGSDTYSAAGRMRGWARYGRPVVADSDPRA